MIVTGLFCSGFLLPAIGVMGFLFARSRSAEAKARAADENQSTAAAAPSPFERELTTLRETNQVRPLTEDEEGFGIAHLPAGVYGFTGAAQDALPLFARKIYRAFEVHKLSNGEVHLIGFVTETQEERLRSAGEFHVDLFPDPFGESVKLVSIPRSRLIRAKGPSRQDGNALTLEVEGPVYS